MQIGTSLSGLSLLLPLALLGSIGAVRCGAIRWSGADDTLGTWMASVAGGYILYLLSGLAAAELLGACNALERAPLLGWWSVYIAATVVLSWWLWPRRNHRGHPRSWPAPGVMVAVVLFGGLLGFLFWLGTVAAPNNLDAMNYHLTRATEWATNHNVNDFPTGIAKQLYNGRLAEYFTAQNLLLDGTDRLVFLPQFLAYLVSTVLVAGLARQLGGGRRAALWGLFLASTLPLAILQATTAQTDLVVASIVMAATYLTVVAWQRERLEGPLILFIAAGAGLAVLAKADAVLAVIPLAVALVVLVRRRRPALSGALVWGAVAVGLCVLASLPMTARNEQLYHSVQGPKSGVTVSAYSPADLFTISVESMASNLDTLYPNLDSNITNVEGSVARTLGWTHINPDVKFTTTWPVARATPSEDGSGDLVAYVAVLCALVTLASPRVRARLRGGRRGLALVGVLGATTLILILTTLNWQPWGARFQLIALFPLLAWASVVLAALRRGAALAVVGVVLVGLTLWITPQALVKNDGKPVVNGSFDYLALPRDAQYFRWCPGFQAPYTQAVDEVVAHRRSSLGYVSKKDDFEYPLWALLSQRANGAPVRVVPLLVKGPSARLEQGPRPIPAVVLVSGTNGGRVAVKAAPLVAQGYRLQAITPSSCGSVGIYTLHGR